MCELAASQTWLNNLAMSFLTIGSIILVTAVVASLRAKPVNSRTRFDSTP